MRWLWLFNNDGQLDVNSATECWFSRFKRFVMLLSKFDSFVLTADGSAEEGPKILAKDTRPNGVGYSIGNLPNSNSMLADKLGAV